MLDAHCLPSAIPRQVLSRRAQMGPLHIKRLVASVPQSLLLQLPCAALGDLPPFERPAWNTRVLGASLGEVGRTINATEVITRPIRGKRR